ncbi:hypothetical protein C7M84_021171 [Penaeus vannamei]|uniref:Uncharacterized protein n=1 Tax=Penaeus vannamei TaxID=6689 RepID=A0A3R7PVY5_PENVA|nr:hypothetical protein C7M84_021171 [Penaeus vannamei]
MMTIMEISLYPRTRVRRRARPAPSFIAIIQYTFQTKAKNTRECFLTAPAENAHWEYQPKTPAKNARWECQPRTEPKTPLGVPARRAGSASRERPLGVPVREPPMGVCQPKRALGVPAETHRWESQREVRLGVQPITPRWECQPRTPARESQAENVQAGGAQLVEVARGVPAENVRWECQPRTPAGSASRECPQGVPAENARCERQPRTAAGGASRERHAGVPAGIVRRGCQAKAASKYARWEKPAENAPWECQPRMSRRELPLCARMLRLGSKPSSENVRRECQPENAPGSASRECPQGVPAENAPWECQPRMSAGGASRKRQPSIFTPCVPEKCSAESALSRECHLVSAKTQRYVRKGVRLKLRECPLGVPAENVLREGAHAESHQPVRLAGRSHSRECLTAECQPRMSAGVPRSENSNPCSPRMRRECSREWEVPGVKCQGVPAESASQVRPLGVQQNAAGSASRERPLGVTTENVRRVRENARWECQPRAPAESAFQDCQPRTPTESASHKSREWVRSRRSGEPGGRRTLEEPRPRRKRDIAVTNEKTINLSVPSPSPRRSGAIALDARDRRRDDKTVPHLHV